MNESKEETPMFDNKGSRLNNAFERELLSTYAIKREQDDESEDDVDDTFRKYMISKRDEIASNPNARKFIRAISSSRSKSKIKNTDSLISQSITRNHMSPKFKEMSTHYKSNSKFNEAKEGTKVTLKDEDSLKISSHKGTKGKSKMLKIMKLKN